MNSDQQSKLIHDMHVATQFAAGMLANKERAQRLYGMALAKCSKDGMYNNAAVLHQFGVELACDAMQLALGFADGLQSIVSGMLKRASEEAPNAPQGDPAEQPES